MKKIFNAPEIDIMLLGAQDIITTSVGDNNPVPPAQAPEEQLQDW